MNANETTTVREEKHYRDKASQSTGAKNLGLSGQEGIWNWEQLEVDKDSEK